MYRSSAINWLSEQCRSEEVAVLFEPQLTVPEKVVLDVDEKVARDVEFAEIGEGGNDGFQSHAGCRGVPDRKRRDPVGVDVFRALHQFRKHRQTVAGLFESGVVDFEEDGSVALGNERFMRVENHRRVCFPSARWPA